MQESRKDLRQALSGRKESPDDCESTADAVKETAMNVFVVSSG